jgi:hypothetical protein
LHTKANLTNIKKKIWFRNDVQKESPGEFTMSTIRVISR